MLKRLLPETATRLAWACGLACDAAPCPRLEAQQQGLLLPLPAGSFQVPWLLAEAPAAPRRPAPVPRTHPAKGARAGAAETCCACATSHT